MSKNHNFLFAFVAIIAIAAFIGCDLSGPMEQATGTITGRATFSNSTSHQGIVVSLEKFNSRRTEGISRVLTDQTLADLNGEYQFTDIPEGVYTIYASSNDSSEKAVYTSIRVEKGCVVTASDLNLTAVGSISGRIKLDGLEDGDIGFTVFIANTSYMAITGDGGGFRITNIPSGELYELIVMRGIDIYHRQNVVVVAGSALDLEEIDIESNLSTNPVSIIWKGELDAAPTSPQVNWAYYNTTDEVSYIFNVTVNWRPLHYS